MKKKQENREKKVAPIGFRTESIVADVISSSGIYTQPHDRCPAVHKTFAVCVNSFLY